MLVWSTRMGVMWYLLPLPSLMYLLVGKWISRQIGNKGKCVNWQTRMFIIIDIIRDAKMFHCQIFFLLYYTILWFKEICYAKKKRLTIKKFITKTVVKLIFIYYLPKSAISLTLPPLHSDFVEPVLNVN